MIEIPERLKNNHEAQAPSVTDETLSKQYMKKKKKNCHELVLLKSPRRVS